MRHDEYYEAADEEAGAEMAETEGAAEGENAEAAPDLPDNGFAVSDEGFITKLWGVENGGSYGYYVNNVAGYGDQRPD